MQVRLKIHSAQILLSERHVSAYLAKYETRLSSRNVMYAFLSHLVKLTYQPPETNPSSAKRIQKVPRRIQGPKNETS